MTSVTLVADEDEPIDHAHFFKGCETASLTELAINSASPVSPAVRYFMRKDHEQCELLLDLPNTVYLRSPGVGYTIHCHGELSFAHEPELISLLHRVTKLDLDITEYADLYESTAWTRTLPALTQLTFAVLIRGRIAPITPAVFDVASPIEAPALEVVSFTVDRHGNPLLALPCIRPAVLSLAGARLADVILLSADPELFLAADLSCLAGLARRLTVCKIDGSKTITVYERDEF